MVEEESAAAAPPAGAMDRGRLIAIAVVAPVLFLVLVQAARPRVVETLGDRTGHLVIGAAVILSAVLFGLLVVRLIETNRRVSVEHQRELAVRAERDRIAREMHDSLAQVLAVTNLRLRALSADRDLTDAQRTEIDDLAQISRDAHRDVREAILGLRTAGTERRSFHEALTTYLEGYTRQSGVPTTLSADTDAPVMSPACENEVLRVVQEALTNVRKHAKASAARVTLHRNRLHATIVVEDDGRGFDPDTVADGGYGLRAMHERVVQSGGRLHIDSAPGSGTRITVVVPATTSTRHADLRAPA